MAILHLICGLPGSGKTTLALSLARDSGAIRLAPDDWMRRLGADGYDDKVRAAVEGLQWELAQQLLTHGVSVILEAGFWFREERDRFRRRATELGAETRLHFLDAPKDELVRRLTARNAAVPEHSYHVDPADLDAWIALFEPPGPDEMEA